MMGLRQIFIGFWTLSYVLGLFFPVSGQTDSILILSSKGDLFKRAEQVVISELSSEFAITSLMVNDSMTIAEIGRRFTAAPMRVTMLIGEKTIRHFALFADANRNETALKPVVAILAPDVQRETIMFRNVRGIENETPMVTALVSFRHVIGMPIKTVGVVYRKGYRDFIAKHTEFCKREQFVIRGIMISDNVATRKVELEKALGQLVRKDAVQAQWVPNDKALLTPDLIRDVWVPMFAGRKIPIIVGDKTLVKPELNFGTYAVIPDPEEMGVQAAGIVYDIKDNGWECNGTTIYPVIATYSVLNLQKAVEITGKRTIDTSEIKTVIGERK